MAAQSLVASQSLPEVSFALAGNSWNLPEPRDYGHACELGRQYAAKVARFLRETPGAAGANVVGRMAAQIDYKRQDDGRGIWIGFFSALEVVIRDAERYRSGMKRLVGELPPEPAVDPIGIEIEPAAAAPLIDVREGEIGGVKMNVVDARELHAFLCVGKDFSNWLRERVEQYDFVENQDFGIFAESGEKLRRGRPTKDYTLSLDMAKELSMVERNAKGKQARTYFIACERRLLAGTTTQPQVPQTYAEALRLAADLAERNEALERQVAQNATASARPATRAAIVRIG